MIRSKRGFLLAGALTLVLGLVALFPARVAKHYFLPPSVAVSGISGTVWNGAAAQALVEGVYVRQMTWTLRPLSLFTGKLSYATSARPSGGSFDAIVDISAGGDISFTGLDADLPLGLFAGALGLRELRGEASLLFDRLELSDGLATVADGTAEISNLVIPLIDRNSLGSYIAVFKTQNNGLLATIDNADSVIDLNGSLQVKTDRSYVFRAQVSATPQTPQSIQRQMRFLPVADDPNKKDIRLEGVL